MTLTSDRPKAIARRAAQYVRMSTDMQRYSTDNQQAMIALYASTHGLDIVQTYADEGKSGLKIEGRAALRQLIADVRSGNAGFDTILVYDVSRWGRFQDADESAHYEFICREAGISVQYCAEEFENDGSLAATILKTIKRAMAGEYSRELSAKVFIGKCNIIKKGFRAGGRAGYGLRRMVLDEHGARKGSLQDGQQKFLHTDRTILVPGPPDEVQTVHWIFDRFTRDEATLGEIATELNAQGIKNGIGNKWVSHAVRGMLSNEKYIGNNVFNQTSTRLKQKCVRHPPHRWIRAEGAFEAIIDKTMFDLAQVRLSSINLRHTDFHLLDCLTALWCRHGELSTDVVQKAPLCPSTSTFIKHFGSVLEAFKRVGYRKLSRRPVYSALRKSIADRIIEQVQALGGTARHVGLRRQSRLLINDEVLVTVALAHWAYKTRNGKLRWILKHSVHHHSDLVVLARFGEKSPDICDYFLLPGLALDNPQQMVMDLNHLQIDGFKASSLAPLTMLFERQSLSSVPANCRASAKLTPTRRASAAKVWLLEHPRSRKRNAAARTLLRSFEMQSNRMISFIEKCDLVKGYQLKMEDTLQFLLSDRSFCKLLFDENLDTLPVIVAKRLSSNGPANATPQYKQN